MTIHMSIIDILLKEHNLLRDQVKTLLEADNKDLNKVDEFISLLKFHQDYEEKILYSKIKNSKLEDKVLEGYEEHRVLDFTIDEVESTNKNDETWEAKMKVLSENLEHHFKEEEDEIFPSLKNILGVEKLYEMGQQFSEKKQDWQNGNSKDRLK